MATKYIYPTSVSTQGSGLHIDGFPDNTLDPTEAFCSFSWENGVTPSMGGPPYTLDEWVEWVFDPSQFNFSVEGVGAAKIYIEVCVRGGVVQNETGEHDFWQLWSPGLGTQAYRLPGPPRNGADGPFTVSVIEGQVGDLINTPTYVPMPQQITVRGWNFGTGPSHNGGAGDWYSTDIKWVRLRLDYSNSFTITSTIKDDPSTPYIPAPGNPVSIYVDVTSPSEGDLTGGAPITLECTPSDAPSFSSSEWVTELQSGIASVPASGTGMPSFNTSFTANSTRLRVVFTFTIPTNATSGTSLTLTSKIKDAHGDIGQVSATIVVSGTNTNTNTGGGGGGTYFPPIPPTAPPPVTPPPVKPGPSSHGIVVNIAAKNGNIPPGSPIEWIAIIVNTSHNRDAQGSFSMAIPTGTGGRSGYGGGSGVSGVTLNPTEGWVNDANVTIPAGTSAWYRITDVVGPGTKGTVKAIGIWTPTGTAGTASTTTTTDGLFS